MHVSGKVGSIPNSAVQLQANKWSFDSFIIITMNNINHRDH